MIHVRVRLFASLRERLGQSSLTLELNEGATAARVARTAAAGAPSFNSRVREDWPSRSRSEANSLTR
ncbi:MAG: hypothetical protein WAV79_14230, partial [Anaerolineae bacterium]